MNDATVSDILRKGLSSTDQRLLTASLRSIEKQRDQARFIGWLALEVSFQTDIDTLLAHMNKHGIEPLVNSAYRARNKPTIGTTVHKKRGPLRMHCNGCDAADVPKGWSRRLVGDRIKWFCPGCTEHAQPLVNRRGTLCSSSLISTAFA